MRWIARNSGVAVTAEWTPARTKREHEAAERELEQAGF
jgi:hypothetical protein